MQTQTTKIPFPLKTLFLYIYFYHVIWAIKIWCPKDSVTHVQVSGRWYYSQWVVSTVMLLMLIPWSEMMHCAAWPSFHSRNWVGWSLRSGDEHSGEEIQ